MMMTSAVCIESGINEAFQKTQKKKNTYFCEKCTKKNYKKKTFSFSLNISSCKCCTNGRKTTLFKKKNFIYQK